MSLHLSKCHIVGNHMSWLNNDEQLRCAMATSSAGNTTEMK